MNLLDILFVAWISSGTIQVQGITVGSLGQGDMDQATYIRACATLEEKRKIYPDATLYAVVKSKSGICDWNCEWPILIVEVKCELEQPPERTIIVPVEAKAKEAR